MDILVIDARAIRPILTHDLVRTFVEAGFAAEERQSRRLAKVNALEKHDTIQAILEKEARQ